MTSGSPLVKPLRAEEFEKIVLISLFGTAGQGVVLIHRTVRAFISNQFFEHQRDFGELHRAIALLWECRFFRHLRRIVGPDRAPNGLFIMRACCWR